MRRRKPARSRSVLLVPELTEQAQEELRGRQPELDRSTGEREPSSVPLFSRPEVEDEPSRGDTRAAGWHLRRSRWVVVLALLLAAGILVGRGVKELGDDPAPPTKSGRGATPAPSVNPKWGPLEATSLGRLAAPREGAAAVVAGGDLVVLGGLANGKPDAAVLRGSPQGVVARVASLPGPLSAGIPLVRPDAVYLVGGERGNTVTDGIVRFDLATQNVTFAGKFFEPLAGAGYAQVGDDVLIVGGWTGEKLATGILRYSLDGDPALVTRLPEATRDPAVALHGGRLYVAGGRTAAGPTRNVYAVDLASGTVEKLGELPRPLAGGTLVSAGGRLYLLGGRGGGGPVATITRIDPKTGTIAPAGQMPAPLAGAAAVRRGNTTLVVGGTRGAAGAIAEIQRLGH